MYGVGFITFYYPILSMLSEYWIKRRGMMAGIMCSASGLSGTMFPFAIESALRKYGYPTTLRAIAIGLCVLTGPLIPFLNGRLPETDVRATAIAKTDWSFMRSSLFWVYSVSNLAMGFGYFFPSLYIPFLCNRQWDDRSSRCASSDAHEHLASARAAHLWLSIGP
jgi:hypothetical protein